VIATIEIVGGAALAEGETATKNLDTIPGGGSAEVTWTLVCTSTEAVTITVTPAGTDANSGEAADVAPDTVTVNQETPAHLVADITAPAEGDTFSVGQEFVVSATISNTGEADALDVIATIEIVGGAALAEGETATKNLDTIPGGGSAEVTWTLVCTSGEAVTITVAPAGTDENTGVAIPEANLVSDSVTINQLFTIYLPLVAKNYTP